MSIKRYFLISLIIAQCFLNIPSAFPFSVEPSRIELSISPGGSKGKTVTIDNTKSDTPLHVKIYAQDVVILPDGTNDFPPAGSTEWSCANWVKAIPEEVDILPGKTQSVRINVSVPPQAKGGYYAMVFFETSSNYSEGLGINFRLGGLLDVAVKNTAVYKAQLVNILLTDSKKIEIDIFNEGNILLRPKGTVQILNAQGKKVRQLNFNSEKSAILPKSLRKFFVELDQPLAAGKYNLKAKIDFGAKYILSGEIPIEIK